MNSLQCSFTTSDPFSPFATEIGVRINHTLKQTFCFNVCDNDIEIEVKYVEPEVYSMRVKGIGPWRRVTGTLKNRKNLLKLYVEIDECITKATITKIHNKLHIFTKVSQFYSQIPSFEILLKNFLF